MTLALFGSSASDAIAYTHVHPPNSGVRGKVAKRAFG